MHSGTHLLSSPYDLPLTRQYRCIVYRGPDEKYVGRDICYGYNEDTLTIYDA